MTNSRRDFLKNGVLTAAMTGMLGNIPAFAEGPQIDYRDRIGLNFVRADYGHPGNYTFMHKGVWLTDQFQKIGLHWTRLAFSWVVVQPEESEFAWKPYDRVVDSCRRK